jgi:hypothetical protein
VLVRNECNFPFGTLIIYKAINSNSFMQRVFLRLLFLGWCLAGLATAQGPLLMTPASDASVRPPASASADPIPASTLPAQDQTTVSLVTPAVLPRMAPELALQVCRGRSIVQTAHLASYSATTLIRAQLPDTSQSGDYELQQNYIAPRTLTFKAVKFTGDSFVKTNVITRLLQSEVDHVQKDDPSLNAISPANYKFSYKGTSQLDGRLVHVYQVKPRQKRPGLFKGRIFVDAYKGSLVRAEGKPAKSPSLFIKKLEFVQDYTDIGSFTFPVHIHSEARARIVGHTIVDVYQRDYQPVSDTATSAVVAAHSIPAL